MFQWKKDQDLGDQAEEYAAHYDFRRIFSDGADGLELLALLLTGDRTKAEQCLVPGLNSESKDNHAFHDWAHSWSKRAIIKNAIQAVSPSPEADTQKESDLVSSGYAEPGTPKTLADAVSCLEPFERFVFIMALVEGYSVQECSAMLGTTPNQVTIAKSHAVEHVAALLPVEESPQISPLPMFVSNEKTA
jgi:hypothetical protein